MRAVALAKPPNTSPDPPAYLGEPEAELWRRLTAEYMIVDSAGLVLLEQLCRNLQLARECREIVEAEGKLKGTREHPLLKVWRDSEKQAYSALRGLNFDLEPLRDKPGRPPGGRGI